MKTWRFKTKISKSGTIQLPKNALLNDKEVDVIIISRTKRIRKTIDAKGFIEKWAGFLASVESDDPKFDYLMEKHM